MTQLNLFSDRRSDSTVLVDFKKRKDDWSFALVDGIIQWRMETLTKQQLLDICNRAVKRERTTYGHHLFIHTEQGNEEVYIRICEQKTRKHETAEQYIENYFEMGAEAE